MTLLTGIATALPRESFTQEESYLHAGEVSRCTRRDRQILERLYQRTEIQRRGSVVMERSETQTPITEFFPIQKHDEDFGPSTAERMAYYERFAKQLSIESCRETLRGAEIDPKTVSHLVSVSCTGFGAPGFDVNLVKELELPSTVFRTHVGFMGCHGTMNGLRLAQGFTSSDKNAVVLLCATEICSVHFQYGRAPGNVVANSLFADGAASLIMSHSPAAAIRETVSYADSFSFIVPNSEDAMTWKIGNHGFSMTLSAEVPHFIEQQLRPLIQEWLSKHDLAVEEIASWAVHPGGPRILTAIENALNLPSDALCESRAVLAEHGNMSSPTVLFILQRLLKNRMDRLPCVMLAFGPGLTIEAALLR